MSNTKLSSPAVYPKNRSYKAAVNEVLTKMNKKENSKDEASVEIRKSKGPIDKPLQPGEIREVHTIRGGGTLSITKKKDSSEEVKYLMICADGKKVMLEKASEHVAIAEYDTEGNAVRTIGCEI